MSVAQLTPQDIDYILSTPPSDIQNFKSQVITKVLKDEAILEPRRIQLAPTDILVFSDGLPLPTSTQYAEEILDPFLSGPPQEAQRYDTKKIDEYKQKSPKLVLWFTPTLAGPRANSDIYADELTQLHNNLGKPCKIFVVFTQPAYEESSRPPRISSSKIKGIFWLYYNTTYGRPSHIMKTKTDDTPNTHYINSRDKLHRHFKYREGYNPNEDPPQTEMTKLDKIQSRSVQGFMDTTPALPKKSPWFEQGVMAFIVAFFYEI